MDKRGVELVVAGEIGFLKAGGVSNDVKKTPTSFALLATLHALQHAVKLSRS